MYYPAGLSTIALSILCAPAQPISTILPSVYNFQGPISKGLLGRCKRFALYVVDGVVKYSVIAEDIDFDPAGDDFPEKVLAPAILEAIKETK
jgi:peroxiredoxin 5